MSNSETNIDVNVCNGADDTGTPTTASTCPGEGTSSSLANNEDPQDGYTDDVLDFKLFKSPVATVQTSPVSKSPSTVDKQIDATTPQVNLQPQSLTGPEQTKPPPEQSLQNPASRRSASNHISLIQSATSARDSWRLLQKKQRLDALDGIMAGLQGA